ncbi:ABC transporter permease subunit [Cytobacillus praedii]|uniref:ABC transporter permease subunit n=2 Tax=Cytobacillus praedii TaxID=1742358 RepID=UPI002E1CD38A|nr:ABC transporter permease subunit [Cytobacillus praedii]MED3571529.1 ABC transporter permease subunit [Cytobacillus praedii]
MTALYRHVLSLFLLLILAALPLSLFNKDEKVSFDIAGMAAVIKEFLMGLFSGDAWYYSQGGRTRLILNDLVSYFLSSYLYLIVSAIIVIAISIFLGIFLWKKSNRWINASIGFLGMVPDFLLVLMLQIAVVYVNKNLGVKTFKVASSSIDDPAIFLPILTLIIIPAIYLVRSLSEATSEITAEDYILLAKSKGLSKKYIYFFHVTTNVLPFLKADLHKVLSIMIGNLFIVEYLYNTRGLTSLIFLHSIKFGYQYNLVIICLLSLFILYLFCYHSLRLLLAAAERRLAK